MNENKKRKRATQPDEKRADTTTKNDQSPERSRSTPGLKALISLAVVSLMLGLVIGLFASKRIYTPGCKTKISILQGNFDTDCPGSSVAVPISFGQQPSRIALADALSRVADLTSASGPANVTVDPRIAQSAAGKTLIQPPAGDIDTATALHRMIGDAGARETIWVCLKPEGGIEVRLRQ